jgi:hypothetical protein
MHIIVDSILDTYSRPGIYFYFTCHKKFCLSRTRCVCYVTLSLTPRGLNLCQIVMWNYFVNMIMYMYKTFCSARLENELASGCLPRFCWELYTACYQFVQNKNYVSYVLCINSRTIFPRSSNWPCTLKNPCYGGWKISVGRLLLINLLAYKIWRTRQKWASNYWYCICRITSTVYGTLRWYWHLYDNMTTYRIFFIGHKNV